MSPNAQKVDGAPLLEVVDLVTCYPVRRGLVGLLSGHGQQWVRAVDGISFIVEPGEIVALVGESGCGKTTTAHTLTRMIDPHSGTIRLEGRDISRLPSRRLRPLRRRMQLIYQDPYESLDPRMRVRDAVAEALDIHGLTRSKAERERKIVEALTLVGLAPPDLYLDRFPHELSGGQRQRVGIAAAMVLNPSLLVADEPVSMLDVSARAGVLRVFTELSQRGVGIVTITHDLSTAAGFADRIYVMYLGRIIEHGRAKEVVRNPQHPYTKALMSVIPARDPHIGRRPQILSGEIPNPMNVPRGCRFHPRCPAAISRCRDIDPQLHDARAARSPDHQAACILA